MAKGEALEPLTIDLGYVKHYEIRHSQREPDDQVLALESVNHDGPFQALRETLLRFLTNYEISAIVHQIQDSERPVRVKVVIE